MKILAINTAGVDTQIAVIKDNEKFLKNAGFSRHSETLFPLLDDLLGVSGVKVGDFDSFACVVGPGSFTGIRIGMSVVKGFAYAKNKPIIAINSMEMLAYNIIEKDSKRPICAVINAGAGLVYHQTFERINTEFGLALRAITQPRLDKIKHFTGYLHSNYNDAVDLIYNHNNEKSASFADLLGDSQDYLVENLAKIAEYKFLRQEFVNAVTVAPLYLRVSQAEQNLGEIEFRQAGLDDLPDLLKLENQDDEWDLQWNEIGIRQSFENPNFRCFLMKSKGEAKGFISVNLLSGEAEILRVVVLKEARLQGVASKMIDNLIEILRKIDCVTVFLEVNDQNYPAISLYQKKGFIEVGRRPDYYEKGEDAILMRLDF